MSDADHSPRRAPRPPEPRRAPAPQGAAPRARLALPLVLCAALLIAPFLLHRPAGGSSAAGARTSVSTSASGGGPGASRTASGGAVRSGHRAASRSADVTYTAAQLAALQAAASGMVSIEAASPAVPAAATPGPDPAPSTTSTTSAPAAVTAAQSPPPAARPQASAPRSTTTTTEAPTTTTTTEAPTTTTTERPTTTTTAAPSQSETGSASWYQAPSGTCAHPSLPFGTVVTVTNLANGATTKCTVEDRGPYQSGRIIDLSEGTFAQIASTSDGVIQVRIQW